MSEWDRTFDRLRREILPPHQRVPIRALACAPPPDVPFHEMMTTPVYAHRTNYDPPLTPTSEEMRKIEWGRAMKPDPISDVGEPCDGIAPEDWLWSQRRLYFHPLDPDTVKRG